MYNFIDVNETSETILPSEALMLNGEYIENLVAGYRTLSVSGREALSPDLETYETGASDGERLKKRRFPARTIIVKYQLIADSDEAFRAAYNTLGGILNVTDAELIFNDEQDKFFIGTPSAIGEVEAGKNVVVGEIEFLCTDPFKYSVVEYEAEADIAESSVLIDYGGTYKAFPKLETSFYQESEVNDDGETAETLTGNGDCGYVAFFNENEKIIQLGNPQETDDETYAKAQTLINQSFRKSTSWGKTASSYWTANDGVLLPSTVKQLGSVTMGGAVFTGGSTNTSGTLIVKRTTSGTPLVTYAVSAKTTERAPATVKVTVTVKATPSAGFGTGKGLKAYVYMGGQWHGCTLKTGSASWTKGKSYTATMTFTVYDLQADETTISSIKFKVERTDSGGEDASLDEVTCNDLRISAYIEPTPTRYYLTASSYGSASDVWHGAAITRAIPDDAAGDSGAANFVLTVVHKMHIGDGKYANNELGAFQMQLTTADGNNLAGARIFKSKAGTKGSVAFYINGKKVYGTTDRNMSFNSGRFGSKNTFKTSTITKSGSKIVFDICGLKKTFTVSAIKTMKAAKITFSFERYSSNRPLAYNGLYSVKFVKNNCDTWEDVPNKFSANDVLIADCNDGSITLNGNAAQDLGALGNDWEDFYLKPGLNQIGYTYSDWVTEDYAPTVKVRYREVFL